MILTVNWPWQRHGFRPSLSHKGPLKWLDQRVALGASEVPEQGTAASHRPLQGGIGCSLDHSRSILKKQSSISFFTKELGKWAAVKKMWYPTARFSLGVVQDSHAPLFQTRLGLDSASGGHLSNMNSKRRRRFWPCQRLKPGWTWSWFMASGSTSACQRRIQPPRTSRC